MSIIVLICANNRHFLVCLEFAINRRSLPGNYTWCAVQYGRFLPRDAMHAVVVYLFVRLSVCACVSVTLRNCVKTAKRRMTQIMPHDRPGTLVFNRMFCTVVAEFLLTSLSRGPSAIAEPLVCMHYCGVRTKSPLPSVICDQP